MSEKTTAKNPSGARLYLGLFFLGLSWLMPFSGFFIAGSTMSAPLKALLIGLLSIGGPEIIAVIAIAILGKECFELLSKKAFSYLKKLKPQDKVSKRRYHVGLIMFLLPLLPWYILAYAPQVLPASSNERLLICIASDICFWSSLFVLGADFWDKLRALFIYEAKAMPLQAIPTPVTTEITSD